MACVEELRRSDMIHDRTLGGASRGSDGQDAMQAAARPLSSPAGAARSEVPGGAPHSPNSQEMVLAVVQPLSVPRRKRTKPQDTGRRKSPMVERPPRDRCGACFHGLSGAYTACACGSSDHKFCRACIYDTSAIGNRGQVAVTICNGPKCRLPGVEPPRTLMLGDAPGP